MYILLTVAAEVPANRCLSDCAIRRNVAPRILDRVRIHRSTVEKSWMIEPRPHSSRRFYTYDLEAMFLMALYFVRFHILIVLVQEKKEQFAGHESMRTSARQ